MSVLGLIIHAPNVHRGGGKTLLLGLLRAAVAQTACTLLADARLTLPDDLAAVITLYRFAPTIRGRVGAEYRLKSIADPNHVVLCFGNLPPLRAVDSPVYLFLQNRYVCDRATLSGFPWRARFRIACERRVLRWFLPHARVVVVQTPSMQACVRVSLGVDAKLAPFVDDAARLSGQAAARNLAPGRVTKFLYVATGEPHKNHRTLLEAWRLLAGEGVTAELHLTLDPGDFARTLTTVGADESWRNVINHEHVSGSGLKALYSGVDALVFASTLEAFGLPLIEAKLAGLPVIAPELDYVRDVVAPDQTFDPGSPRSIARAIKRFLGLPDDQMLLLEPSDFVERLLAGRI